MRRTDVFVHEQLRLTPLSVSADRIAHVAALDQTIPPAGDDLTAAAAEGWIVIPDRPIGALM